MCTGGRGRDGCSQVGLTRLVSVGLVDVLKRVVLGS